jgi:hypothetical protein
MTCVVVGVDRGDLIVRCERDETETLLARKGVREFDLSGGRPMKGWLLVPGAPRRTARPGDERRRIFFWRPVVASSVRTSP